MNIIDYYQERCKNDVWYNNYYRCGEIDDGSIFKCFSTNYRDLFSFEYYFKEFKKYIGIPRNQWDKKETTGQEIAKQHVRNMVESFLYISKRNESQESVFELSSRGRDFDRMISSNFTKDEKKLLIFIYLMNSAFKRTPRYLLKRSWAVWDHWSNAGLEESKLINEIESFLIEEIKDKKIENIFNFDIVWYLSFYSDQKFLQLYSIATPTEISELKAITKENYQHAYQGNVLAWKYKGTNFQKPMLIDTLLIIYLSKIIKDVQNNDYSYNEFYDLLLNKYLLFYPINKNKVVDFIIENESVFKIIFKSAISEEDDFTERYIPSYRPINNDEINKLLPEKIDATSQEGVAKLEVVRSVLKKLAKEKSQYKCALHDLNGCNYFTSKEEHKNYLEIHHLVPREFAYNFEDTIEFVENYIPLCPRCHRMIHKAEDRERKHLINFLFNQRHNDLEQHNIKITIKDLFDYYKIDKENR